MTKVLSNVDSGLLQFVPKGAYYEDAEEQREKADQMWENLLTFDRCLFSLLTLLPGSGFAKGAMAHSLLSNPINLTEKSLIPGNLPLDFEVKIMKYNLKNESFARSLKNLLMLTGTEGCSKVNNSKSRKLILSFIFDRSKKSLDGIAVNYKKKLKILIRHALGKQTLWTILNGNFPVFHKWIGCYNKVSTLPVLFHIFGKGNNMFKNKDVKADYPKICQYYKLKEAALENDIVKFKKYMKNLPMRTVMGFRNVYKLDVNLSEVYDQSKIGAKESLQLESAIKKSGAAKKDIDYEKYNVYDLWKSFYFKVLNNETDELIKVEHAIESKTKEAEIDVNNAIVIIDASRSMEGSGERKLHPFLTSLSILTSFKNVGGVVFVGGKWTKVAVKGKEVKVIIPSNETSLWKGLLQTMDENPNEIIIISDGYENSIKGMFNHVYKQLKSTNDFSLIHLNPVFSAGSKQGTTRQLTDDVKPLQVSDYKYLETELLFNKILESPDSIKIKLADKFQKLLK